MTRLFTPGPVNIAPEVLAAQARPMLPYPGQEFEDLFRRIEEKIQRIFFTQNSVFTIPLTGTGMQDILVRNFVTHRVLCCVNGDISLQWQEVAEADGKEVALLEKEWGEPILPDELRSSLEQNPVDAVCLVHIEPSTGVISPLAELAAVVADFPETLLMVDASASLGSVQLETDAWGLPIVFGETHNCLSLPPGLSLAAISSQALEQASKNTDRGYVFDLIKFEKARRHATIPVMPPISLMYALETQCDRIWLDGFENRINRQTELSGHLQSWLAEAGFPLASTAGYQSDTVLCIQNTRGWSFDDLNQYLTQRGLKISNGVGRWRDRVFRIGIMGEITAEDVDALTTALSEYKPF